MRDIEVSQFKLPLDWFDECNDEIPIPKIETYVKSKKAKKTRKRNYKKKLLINKKN